MSDQLQEMYEKVSAKAHRAEQAVIDLTRKVEALSERVKALGGAEPEAKPLTVDDMEPGDHVVIYGAEYVVVIDDGDRVAVPVEGGHTDQWMAKSDEIVYAVLYRRSEMGQ